MKRFSLLLLPTFLGACVTTAPYCSPWDADESGDLYQNEVAMGFFDQWDTDDNGLLTREEYNIGVAKYPALADWTPFFNDWDDDEDGFVSVAEFGAGFADSEYFDEWDVNGNGTLSKSECTVLSRS